MLVLFYAICFAGLIADGRTDGCPAGLPFTTRQLRLPDVDEVVSKLRRQQELLDARDSTLAHRLSDCANLAPAGTGTMTLYEQALSAAPAGRQWKHSHDRRIRSPGLENVSCFIITLRDPAARLESGFRYDTSHWFSHELDRVFRQGEPVMPATTDFVAAFRNGSTGDAWAGVMRTFLGSASHPLATVSGAEAGAQERAGSNFLMSQLDYFRDYHGPRAPTKTRAQVMHVLCTERFDEEWSALLSRRFGIKEAKAYHTNDRAADPKGAAARGGVRNGHYQAPPVTGLSDEDAGFVRKCMFPWDALLHARLCDGSQKEEAPRPIQASPGASTAADRTGVTPLLFSSTPNPTYTLNASSAVALAALLATAPTPVPSCRVVGFRGWLVDGRVLRGHPAVDALLLDATRPFLSADVTSHIAYEARRLLERDDSRCAAASDETDAAAAASDETDAAAVLVSKMVEDEQKKKKCNDVPIVGPDDPAKVHFDKAHDCDGCFVTDQRKNNCYDYGTDIVSSTFAQPGRGSGVCKKTDRPCIPHTCANVSKAAESDGLVWHGTELPDALPVSGHYVSLHIWPDSNFHWLRMDANKYWSHKPGGSPVRNVDNNGDLIDDPAKADVSPWTQHCGYMLAKPSVLTIY